MHNTLAGVHFDGKFADKRRKTVFGGSNHFIETHSMYECFFYFSSWQLPVACYFMWFTNFKYTWVMTQHKWKEKRLRCNLSNFSHFWMISRYRIMRDKWALFSLPHSFGNGKMKNIIRPLDDQKMRNNFIWQVKISSRDWLKCSLSGSSIIMRGRIDGYDLSDALSRKQRLCFHFVHGQIQW